MTEDEKDHISLIIKVKKVVGFYSLPIQKYSDHFTMFFPPGLYNRPEHSITISAPRGAYTPHAAIIIILGAEGRNCPRPGTHSSPGWARCTYVCGKQLAQGR